MNTSVNPDGPALLRSGLWRSFYIELRDIVLAAGVTKAEWMRFIRAVRHAQKGEKLPCWFGQTSPGKMILKAWGREHRVGPDRITGVAQILISALKAGDISDCLYLLKCCRGFEKVWGAPFAGNTATGPMASATTLTDLWRWYFNKDPMNPVSLGHLEHVLCRADPAHQQAFLKLHDLPLGKRDTPPRWKDLKAPSNERYDIVWAVREDDVGSYNDADKMRDDLGLVHHKQGATLVLFGFVFTEEFAARIPTVVESSGWWPFWPGTLEDGQRTMNYLTGQLGPREFVHPSGVGQGKMKCRCVGKLGRNWDGSRAGS